MGLYKLVSIYQDASLTQSEEQKGSDKLRYSLPQCLHSFINFIEL